MKKIYLFMALSIILFVSSCSKDVLPEESETEIQKEANSTLNIRTRTGSDADGDATVSYPVHVYVFNANSECVSYSTLASSTDALSLNLVEGTYTVYSVAGATAESYSIPTKENATADAVVSLLADKQHADLMTAKNTVTLVDGGTNTLTLGLERKVMLLKDITIKKVPTSVTAVSVSISPLYKNICINGGYNEEGVTYTINLTKSDEARTWSNAANSYLMPASSSATVTVSFTNAEGNSTSYSYSCADELEANYKIKLEGTYTGTVGVNLTGTITGATWAGEKTITFDFDDDGSSGSTTTEGNETPEGGDDGSGSEDGGTDEGGETETPATGDIPAVGTFYQNCYVLKHDDSDDGSTTTVTLLSTSLISDITYSDTEQTTIKTVIDNALSSFKVNDIDGWRIINESEALYIRQNIETINAAFTGENRGQAFNSSECYYFLMNDGNIKSFTIQNLPAGWYFDCTDKDELRPVTTITFNNSTSQ